MDNLFKSLKANIDKNVKGVHCSVMSESDIATITDWVPLPTYDLNRVVSGDLEKGLGEKSLTLLVGKEHTFKSSLAVLTAKAAQKKGYKPIIIDTEGGITGEFAKRWGLNIDECLYIYTPWGEEIKGVLAQIKETGEEKFCIILDSIGGIDKKKSFDDALGGEYKQDMGGNARIIKSMLKLLTNIIKTQSSIGVITSHFYSSSGSVPMPDSVVGGKAVMYTPDIILYFKKMGKSDTTKTGMDKLISISTIKNRFYPSAKIGFVSIDFVKGINVFQGMMQMAIELGVIEKAGSWYSYGNERLGQGESNVSEFLTNPDQKKLLDEILFKINEKLKLTGYSSLEEENLAVELEETQKAIEEAEKEAEIEKESFICPHCEKEYKTQLGLTNHIKKEHKE